MVKYIIEGGIDFYEELYKSLDEPDADNDIETCQIQVITVIHHMATHLLMEIVVRCWVM